MDLSPVSMLTNVPLIILLIGLAVYLLCKCAGKFEWKCDTYRTTELPIMMQNTCSSFFSFSIELIYWCRVETDLNQAYEFEQGVCLNMSCGRSPLGNFKHQTVDFLHSGEFVCINLCLSWIRLWWECLYPMHPKWNVCLRLPKTVCCLIFVPQTATAER